MKFSRSDAIFTLAILILASLLLLLFWKDLNSTDLFLRKDALGTIVLRKRSATRRSPGNLNWERLQNNSPVYNQDIIRTADFSEAVVFFDDDSSLDLYENTMIKFDFSQDIEPVFEFTEGRMTLTGGAGKTVQAGTHRVIFSGDTLVSFAEKNDEISIEVDKGKAVIQNAGGIESPLNQSDQFLLNRTTGETRMIAYRVDLTEPVQNARLVSLDPEATEVTYRWHDSGTAGDSLFLETSPRDDFTDSSYYQVTGESVSLPSTPGIHYWRVTDGSEILSSTSRYLLTSDELPSLIQPAQGGEYTYRKIMPSLSFSWSPMESAASYLLEISPNNDFTGQVIRQKTNLTGFSLNNLDEGTWYWRVLPQLAQQVSGKQPDYEVRSLIIKQSDAMVPLDLYYPVEETLYELKTFENEGITLSWESREEAAVYQISVAGDISMENPIWEARTEDSFLNLNLENAPVLSRPGEYYWATNWIDGEGNLSPLSSARSFQGIDGTLALRLSYPPEGYRIADSLIRNSRFTWKTNIPGRKIFQLSADPDFEIVEYEEEVQAETILGKGWSAGKWYWRIRTFNANGTLFLDTPGQSIEIAEPLPQPALLTPRPGETFVYREGDEQKIQWQKVEGSDYYNLRIISGQTSLPVFEKSLLETEEASLSFDSFPDGVYRILVQGFARETDMSTRLIGYLSDSRIRVKKLRPIELLSPVDNPLFPGLEALRQGVSLRWSAPDLPESSELRLYSTKTGKMPLFTKKDPRQYTQVPSLPEGQYYWTVSGSLIGFDISAPGFGYFKVDPIPILPPPVMLTPANGYIIDVERLKESRKLFFDWDLLEGATHYELTIKEKGSKKVLFTTGLIEATEYELEDLGILDKGEYEYYLHGESRNRKGELEQPGYKGSYSFAIELPDLNTLELKEGETYFGY